MQPVNLATVLQAPEESMIHLGQCIHRLISTLLDNYNEKTPFQFAKLGIRAGFWRLEVSDTVVWHFCYVLPQFRNIKYIEDVKVVVPNCLQMRWCESPPFFCAAS